LLPGLPQVLPRRIERRRDELLHAGADIRRHRDRLRRLLSGRERCIVGPCAERGSRQRTERHRRRDQEERLVTGAGHQRAPKRYAMAPQFPWHADPPKFWLWGVAKTCPFAIKSPIHD